MGNYMSLIDDIIEAETTFFTRFANVERRDYGLIYYTQDIPDSHDGNHAHILQPCDINEAVADIEDFYRTKNLTPRINHYSKPGEGFGKDLRAALQARGYEFGDHDNQFLVHRRPSQIKPAAELSIRRVQEPLPELLAMVEQAENQRALRVIRRSLECPGFHLLVGFIDGRPVSMAAVEQPGPVSRVDDVLTAKPFRGKGYCSAVIDELVRYHSREFGGELCLYTSNPTAARIYEKAGFVKIDGTIESWSAWLD